MFWKTRPDHQDLFDMLDVEDKGTLTQAEFADGLLNLLTLLGLIDNCMFCWFQCST